MQNQLALKLVSVSMVLPLRLWHHITFNSLEPKRLTISRDRICQQIFLTVSLTMKPHHMLISSCFALESDQLPGPKPVVSPAQISQRELNQISIALTSQLCQFILDRYSGAFKLQSSSSIAKKYGIDCNHCDIPVVFSTQKPVSFSKNDLSSGVLNPPVLDICENWLSHEINQWFDMVSCFEKLVHKKRHPYQT